MQTVNTTPAQQNIGMRHALAQTSARPLRQSSRAFRRRSLALAAVKVGVRTAGWLAYLLACFLACLPACLPACLLACLLASLLSCLAYSLPSLHQVKSASLLQDKAPDFILKDQASACMPETQGWQRSLDAAD